MIFWIWKGDFWASFILNLSFWAKWKRAPKWKCHLEGAIFSAVATFDIGAVAVKRTRWEEGRGLLIYHSIKSSKHFNANNMRFFKTNFDLANYAKIIMSKIQNLIFYLILFDFLVYSGFSLLIDMISLSIARIKFDVHLKFIRTIRLVRTIYLFKIFI